jgi:hypothetical protein
VPELLTQISAFSVFLAISSVGFLILLASFFFGEIFEHFGDGGWDHDLSHGGPSFFSMRVISVFITGFGGFGAIGVHFGFSVLAASGLGFLSGLGCATAIYSFARFLYSQQATTESKASDLIGQQARTIVAIPAGGMGQIRCQIGEELIDKLAKSKDGSAVPENTIVVVEQLLGEVVIVRPL